MVVFKLRDHTKRGGISHYVLDVTVGRKVKATVMVNERVCLMICDLK